MKRIAARVLLFLLLGAVINVAVAWACVLWSNVAPNPAMSLSYSLAGPQRPPPEILNHVPEDWLQSPYSPSRPYGAVHQRRSTGVGVHLIRTMFMYDVPVNWEGPMEHSYELDVIQAGWPLRAFETWISYDLVYKDHLAPESNRALHGPQGKPDGAPFERSCGVPASPLLSGPGALSRAFPYYAGRHILPLKPRPIAFAANTGFFAALVWLLCGGPASVRRAWRARRNQCLHCAYPIGTSSVCTECGRPVKPRSAVHA